MAKNRLPDPSKNWALEFKREFRRFGIGLVSATIRVDWSILEISGESDVIGLAEKDRQQ